MIRVQDVAYVRFGAPDLDRMERFLSDFGLVTHTRADEVLYARGTDPAPYLHVTERGEPGFRAVGFDADEVAAIMGGNWLQFFRSSFGPAGKQEAPDTASATR